MRWLGLALDNLKLLHAEGSGLEETFVHVAGVVLVEVKMELIFHGIGFLTVGGVGWGCFGVGGVFLF